MKITDADIRRISRAIGHHVAAEMETELRKLRARTDGTELGAVAAMADRVVRVLADARGEPVTRSMLRLQASNNNHSDRFNAAVQALVAAGDVIETTEKRPGASRLAVLYALQSDPASIKAKFL